MLISALILSHLKAGHKVVVIADVAPFELERWRTLMVPRTLEPRLTTFALETLAPVGIEDDIFLRKSVQWAQGAKAAYEQIPFDAIEFFEYAGAAFETLLHRNKYLPSSVRIVARIHGSPMLIDIASSLLKSKGPNSVYSNSFNPGRQRMYLMERYVLMRSDFVISPSKSLANIYVDAYHIQPSRIHIGLPCMREMLSELHAKSVAPKVEAAPPPSFLFYGSLQTVKGYKVIIDASICY